MHGRLSDAFGHYLINPTLLVIGEMPPGPTAPALVWSGLGQRRGGADSHGSGLGLSGHISATLPTHAINHEMENPGEQSGWAVQRP